MQGPRADFACLSKKCQQDGAATVYELPVAAVRCPVCASKRISRLYNAVNVSSGQARRVDAIVEPAYGEAMARKEAAEEAIRAKRVDPGFAVPIGNVGGALSRLGQQYGAAQALGVALPGAGKATPLQTAPGIIGQQIQRRPPRPGPGSRVDREYTIKNGQPARA